MATQDAKDRQDAKDDAPVDNRDALEVLESEAKEWEKVCTRILRQASALPRY